MQNIIKQLNNAEKALSALAHSKHMPENENGIWLYENAKLLAQSLSNGIRLLKSRKDGQPSDFFVRLQTGLLSLSFPITQERLTGLLSELSPSVILLEAVPTLLFCACAYNAVSVYRKNVQDNRTSLSVKAMYELKKTDFSSLWGKVCQTERLMEADPAGVYMNMDDYTKSRYRKQVFIQAKQRGLSEEALIKDVLAKAENAEGNNHHIGFYLFNRETHKTGGRVFLCLQISFSLLLDTLFTFISVDAIRLYGFWKAAIASGLFLLFFPVCLCLIKPLFRLLSCKLYKPKPLFCMGEDKITAGFPKTVITVSDILPNAANAQERYEHFSELYHTCSGCNAVVLGLFDRKSADKAVLPNDKADEKAMKELFDRLNRENGGGFVMALRERSYQKGEGEYCGDNRKRGAVNTLIRLLTEQKNGFSVLYGDVSGLFHASYLFMLDRDTVPALGALKKLLLCAMHPLNKPVLNRKGNRVISGYGCFVPVCQTELHSSLITLFSRIQTVGGSANYSPLVCEQYMDMFGTSLFTGKGLIDVNIYSACVLNAFSAGVMLSHDIPEGALLKTALVHSAFVSESFPTSVSSYFKRQERWVRGDTQNALFLFQKTVKNENGVSLPLLTKWQLTDNILRNLTPVFGAILCMLSPFVPHKISALFLLSGILTQIIDTLPYFIRTVFAGVLPLFSRLYSGGLFTDSMRDFLRMLLNIGLLPAEAAVNATAAVRSVYRLTVSKKKLMQWTTAMQGEGQNPNKWCYAFIPVMFSFTVAFSGSLGGLLTLLCLLCVPFSLSDGIFIKPPKKQTPTEEQKDFLYANLAAMWQFFADTVTKEENFLPPDHVELSPVAKTVHRTSPTNIGLYLLSAVAAADCALLSSEELFHRINDTFTVLESLPKYNGLLYNWYATLSLKPITPYYISTVDCGNFLTCLTACKEALREYSAVYPPFHGLYVRAEKMLSQANIGCLYDKNRKLFTVGYDLTRLKPSDSYYDLFFSEALLTSYYAVAKGEVPASHWQALARNGKLINRYAAGISWTGTAFEYFMPTLLIPNAQNTLINETLKTVFREQKNAFQKAYPVFGVSEGQYYALDGEYGYMYKAHGIRLLAQKQLAAEEPVFAPYASFLFLRTNIQGAIKNLKRFMLYNGFGKYGFYEALDFTKERLSGQDYMPVKSYMSHHVGMSMVAAANALHGNIFVNRFMRDIKMRAGNRLLEEKIPTGVLPKQNTKITKTEVTVKKAQKAYLPELYSAYCAGNACLLMSQTGENLWIDHGISVFSRLAPIGNGIFAGLQIDGAVTPVIPSVGICQLYENRFFTQSEIQGFLCRASLFLCSDSPVLVLPFFVKNTMREERALSLLWYFEPLLQSLEGHINNRFYEDLMIKTEHDDLNRILLFTKRHGDVQKCLAVGFLDGGEFLFEANRETALNRTVMQAHPFQKHMPEFTNKTASVSPCGAVKRSIRLKGQQKKEVLLLLALGDTKEQAIELIEDKKRTQTRLSFALAAKNPFVGSKIQAQLSEQFLKQVFFNRNGQTEPQNASFSVSVLYPYGISGEKPFIAVNGDDLPKEYTDAALSLHKALLFSSVKNDFVLFTRKPADYRSPLYNALLTHGELNAAHVHVVDGKPGFSEAQTVIKALPGLTVPGNNSIQPTKDIFSATQILPCKRGVPGENGFVPGGYFINRKLSRPMSHTLCNAQFGTLLTDTSLGYTWSFNSLLNPLTSKNHGVGYDFTGERFFIQTEAGIFEPVREASVYFSADKAVYVALLGDMRIKLTVQVDRVAMKKRIGVQILCSGNGSYKTVFRFVPVMSANEAQKALIRTAVKENGFILYNAADKDFAGHFGVFCTAPVKPQINSAYELSKECTGNAEFEITLVFSRCQKGVEALLRLPFTVPDIQSIRLPGLSPVLRQFGEGLLYHTVKSSRFFAKTGYYQCSGAYGFRDQLQDAMALLDTDEELVKRHIFRCASAQFYEGDVLHWFHVFPFDVKRLHGVKSRCSDDLLWLPLAVCAYIQKTGKHGILSVHLPFLEGKPLKENERERYAAFEKSTQKATLYTHCLKAIMKAATKGVHGLPLMGTGDWNDSFSAVGEKGKGESVFVAMLLKLSAERFIPLSLRRGDTETAEQLKEIAAKTEQAVMKYGYNGVYFIRGYYDDGTPLGDLGQPCCKIDLLPQAFAVFADIGNSEQRKKALRYTLGRLWDEENGILSLFAPPFDNHAKHTGYVNDYLPGVRENGGQYTHAAVWLITALLKEGFFEDAKRLTEKICPIVRAKAGNNNLYQSEPYALCSDVYTAYGLKGKGGWSLYTGASGWYLTLLRLLNEEKN